MNCCRPVEKRGRQAPFSETRRISDADPDAQSAQSNGQHLYVSGSRAVYDAEKPCAADHDGCGDLFVLCKVALQVVDLCGQQCNLNFGRTAVVFATTKLRNDFCFSFNA